MKVTRTSSYSEKIHVMEVPITQEQLTCIENGEAVETVVPKLNEDYRYYLQFGITPDEWNDFFKSID